MIDSNCNLSAFVTGPNFARSPQNTIQLDEIAKKKTVIFIKRDENFFSFVLPGEYKLCATNPKAMSVAKSATNEPKPNGR